MKPLPKRNWLPLLILPLLISTAHAANVSPSSLNLVVGANGTVSVSRIKGTATLANANATVVKATLSGGKLLVTGLSEGSATLSVTDGSGTRTVQVTVMPPMSVDPASLDLTVKQTAQLKVKNAYGAIRLKNPQSDVVKTSLSGNVINLTALKSGTSFLQVSDSKTKAIVQVKVAPPAPPPVPASSLNGRLLASNCYQCHGTNGSGGFDRLAGSNELLDELREFASGKEGNGIMAAHAMGYSDEQMRAIADFLAKQQ